MFEVTLNTTYTQHINMNEQRDIRSTETIGNFTTEQAAANFGNKWAYAWEVKNAHRAGYNAMYKVRPVA